jgi:hypothetical protein
MVLKQRRVLVSLPPSACAALTSALLEALMAVHRSTLKAMQEVSMQCQIKCHYSSLKVTVG